MQLQWWQLPLNNWHISGSGGEEKGGEEWSIPKNRHSQIHQPNKTRIDSFPRAESHTVEIKLKLAAILKYGQCVVNVPKANVSKASKENGVPRGCLQQ